MQYNICCDTNKEVAKIFHLHKLIKWYICQHTELDRLQFAYRSGRSTLDAVLQPITTVTTCIDAEAIVIHLGVCPQIFPPLLIP